MNMWCLLRSAAELQKDLDQKERGIADALVALAVIALLTAWKLEAEPKPPTYLLKVRSVAGSFCYRQIDDQHPKQLFHRIWLTFTDAKGRHPHYLEESMISTGLAPLPPGKYTSYKILLILDESASCKSGEYSPLTCELAEAFLVSEVARRRSMQSAIVNP